MNEPALEFAGNAFDIHHFRPIQEQVIALVLTLSASSKKT
jgi:hypothetical protein